MPRILVSYLTLRRLVGGLGVTLPVLLIAGCMAFGIPLKSSISAYYASGMRDIFVGILFTVGFFLFAYKGHDDTDDRAGDLACAGALGVALFPATTCRLIVDIAHYASALVLFGALVYFSLVLFRKSTSQPDAAKLRRNAVYRACGWIMVACIVAIAVVHLMALHTTDLKPVLWLETLLLWAFGFSWFVKGRALRRLGL